MQRLGLPAALASLLLIGSASAAGAGAVEGRVSLAVEGAAIEQVGPIVVFLESRDGMIPGGPRGRAEVRQHAVQFQPSFLVVAAGQPVVMPNDDGIFHNVFSVSHPNDFDLGTYPAGQAKTVTFAYPGLVRIYCSIHEGMSGGIYVTPTAWFDTAAATGAYRIGDVPEGRYRLTVWNERFPETTRDVNVAATGSRRVDVALGSQ